MRGERQDRGHRASAAADGAVGGDRVGLGGDAAGHPRRAGDGDQRLVASDQCLAKRGERGGLLLDRVVERCGAAEVVGEGEVDDAVGPLGCGADHAKVGEAPADRRTACCLDGPGGGIGAGERVDRVIVGEELGDDSGTDQAGAAGDEDLHGTLLE